MARTFSGSYTTTQILSNPTADNPATVTSSGTIAVNSLTLNAAGIFGDSSFAWTISNFGTVSSIGNSGLGIDLAAGGTIINGQSGVAGGLINGTGSGIRILGGAGTVTNYGSISQTGGGSGDGVLLGGGGTVQNFGSISSQSGNGHGVNFSTTGSLTNAAGARISSAHTGVNFIGAGTVSNSGTIITSAPQIGAGIELASGGQITNGVGGLIQAVRGAISLHGAGLSSGTTTANATITNFGTITGRIGIGVGLFDYGEDTIINYGTIIGTSGTAIRLGDSSHDRVVIASGSSVLQGAIAGFDPGDTFDLPFMAFDTAGSVNLLSGNVLQIVENSGTATINLDPSEDFTGLFFHLSNDGAGGTLVTEDNTPCYCRGTLILTPAGEVPIEQLKIRDKVTTQSGQVRPIKWIGRRAYNPRFIAGNRKILPVRIEAGALGDGVPARDLWVSPEHALYLDGALAPAWLLINGATIRQAARVARLEYFHIELDTHDVILAEGAAAETFVDCDNRGMFQNWRDFGYRYPAAAPTPWEFCAPRAEEGSAELAGIRAKLLARAEALGRVTRDPACHLVVDDRMVPPRLVADTRVYGRNLPVGSAGDGRVYHFAVPAGTRSLSIASRSAVPAESEASSRDGRSLGVAVTHVILRDAGSRIAIGHDCPDLADGFHEPEGPYRWSNGRGWIPEAALASFSRRGDFFIEVHLAKTELHYRIDRAARPVEINPGTRPEIGRPPILKRARG